VALDRGQKSLSLSSIFKWYAPDFGPDQSARLRFIAGFLDNEENRRFIEEQAETMTITYQPYDWRLNQ
jgi:hypothetical protein